MGTPTRILQVLGGLDRGGAETLVMNLYRNMDRDAIQFDFVIHTVENGSYAEEIKQLGGRIYHCPSYKGKNHFSYCKWWKNFLREHPEYPVVHGHVRSTAAIYLKIARKAGRFTVAHSHSTSSGKGLAGLIKTILQFPIRYRADYFLGCSEIANRWLFGNRIAEDSSRCGVLKNGIDLSAYCFDNTVRERVRKELDLRDCLVIGTVGRIEEPKNPFFLLNVFQAIHQKNPQAVLLWVGDGTLAKAVAEKVAELNLGKSVIMTGSRDHVERYMQAMDVFLFPSLWEGLGMALIEAQATGLPCVCSTAIPKEAYITDLVTALPLETGYGFWAEKCCDVTSGLERRSRTQEVRNAGYDIQQVAMELRRAYELHSRSRK